MGSDTKIQWADHTFNPWRGCSKIATGCANCYAEALSKRNPATLGVWGPSGMRVVAAEAMWREPIKWDRQAEKTGERHRVFCASLADVFEDWTGGVANSRGDSLHVCGGAMLAADQCGNVIGTRPARLDDVRARLFSLIDQTPSLDWLLLTKRPENVRRMWVPYGPNAADGEMDEWRSNVWLGVSIACQDDADRLIPQLLKCRDLCAKTFLSIEPMLDDIDIRKWLTWELDVDESRPPGYFTRRKTGPDWIIVGGESGPKARPCNVDWLRSIVRQCRDAGVPPFVKQAGAHVIDSDPISRCSWPGLTNFHFDRVLLRDRKGGDPAEWPEDIRVREVSS